MKWRNALLGVALVIFAERTALADGDEEARAAMRRGVAAFGRGDVETALVEYETAKRLAPNANLPWRYAGEALLSAGRWQEAIDNLEGYIAKNPDVSDAADVRARIANIRAEKLPGRVRVFTDPKDAELLVDGHAAASITMKDGGFELPPGPHHFEARAPSHGTAVSDITVVGDKEVTVSLTLPAFETPSPRRDDTPQPQAPQPGPPHDAGFPWRTVGWIGAAGGTGVLIGSFVLDVGVLGPKLDDYRNASRTGDGRAATLQDQTRGWQQALTVTYVSGLVLLVAGAAVGLFAPAQSSAVSTASRTGDQRRNPAVNHR